jgi:hypothetical protein
MPTTIRKYWGPFAGRVNLNYNWSIIDQDSTVIVTVSEYNPERVRFVGAASISVADIVPHSPPYDPNHGVTFAVNVNWGSPLNVVTDITVLDGKPIETDYFTPPAPQNVGLRMQYQESSEWCWIAVATSINHFYNPASSVTQCQIMTTVGQNINRFPPNTSACPSAAAIAATPGLAAILADPYSQAAEYVLDNPALGIDREYLKSGGVGDALNVHGNSGGYQGKNLSLAQIASEVNARRPVAVDIQWNSGGAHCVAIAGVSGEYLLVLDPVNGASVVQFQSFPSTYFGGATIEDYCFTKAGS